MIIHFLIVEKIIDCHLTQLYELIKHNTFVSKQQVKKAVKPIDDSLEKLQISYVCINDFVYLKFLDLLY